MRTERGERPGKHEHTALQVFANKLPYVVMVALGAAILVLGFEMSFWAWIAAGLYVACGIAGPFWMIMFICPHCVNYGEICHCGYGWLSAKLRPQGETRLFGAKFRRHIPAVFPLWFIPVAAGGVVVAFSFSWWLLSLIAVFVLESFVLLPLVSSKCECARCLQRDACPWVGRKGWVESES